MTPIFSHKFWKFSYGYEMSAFQKRVGASKYLKRITNSNAECIPHYKDFGQKTFFRKKNFFSVTREFFILWPCMAKPCHSIQSLHIEHLINHIMCVSPLALSQQDTMWYKAVWHESVPVNTKEPLRGFNNERFCFVPVNANYWKRYPIDNHWA